MLKSSLCDYRDAYILVSGTITIDGEGADDKNSISEINNTQIDNAKHIDVVMPMYNLI